MITFSYVWCNSHSYRTEHCLQFIFVSFQSNWYAGQLIYEAALIGQGDILVDLALCIEGDLFVPDPFNMYAVFL